MKEPRGAPLEFVFASDKILSERELSEKGRGSVVATARESEAAVCCKS